MTKGAKVVPIFMTFDFFLCLGVDAVGILSIKTGCTATIEIAHTLPSVTEVPENDGTGKQTLHQCFMISSCNNDSFK